MGPKTRPARVTVSKVAATAGVSTTTVSLILSERAEYLRQFNPRTIRKVRDSARRLGYHGNLFASGLPSKATPFFGLVLREDRGHDQNNWHQWAFEGELLAGAVRAAGEARIYPIVAGAPASMDEETLRPLQRIIGGGIFGAVVRTPHPLMEKYLRAQIRRGQPIVIVFPQRLSHWPKNAVDVDNTRLGETAGRLLDAQGRRRWVLLQLERSQEAHILRARGYRRAATACGARLRVVRLPIGLDEGQYGKLLAPRLSRLRPDGIFALDSMVSVGAALGCAEAGLRIGEQVNLVGCDCAMWQNPPMPRITSVDISWKQVGREAVLKLKGMADAGASQFSTLVLAPQITPGESCPVPPELLTSART